MYPVGRFASVERRRALVEGRLVERRGEEGFRALLEAGEPPLLVRDLFEQVVLRVGETRDERMQSESVRNRRRRRRRLLAGRVRGVRGGSGIGANHSSS